jgi:hypothetical protein
VGLRESCLPPNNPFEFAPRTLAKIETGFCEAWYTESEGQSIDGIRT